MLVAMAPAQAALTITSIDIPARIGRGQTVPVAVNFTRASGAGAETVTADVPALIDIVAPLPPGCTLAGASGSPQTLTCTAVDPGSSPGNFGSFSFSARGLTLGGGNVAATNAGPPVSVASGSFTVVSGGDLSIVKSMAPGTTLFNGQTATFTLAPNLSGDSVPAGATITVTDQLPGTIAEFELTAVSAPGYACNGVAAANATRSLVCTASGPLASLGTISAQGRPTLNGAGGLVNTASIAPDGINYIDNIANNNVSQVSFTVEPGSDARPQGSFPAVAVTSTAQTLTLRFVNDGPQTLTGGQVRAAIPVDFVIGPLPAGCSISGPGTVNGVAGTLVTCTSGSVTGAGSQSYAIPLTTPGAAQSGNFGVEVVTGPGGALPGGLTDFNPGNNQTLVPYSIVAPYADLNLSKAKTTGPLPPGAPIANTIVVGNSGLAAAVYSAGSGATPLRVVDTMPNAEEYVSAGAGWTCSDGGADSGGAGQRRVVCVRDAAGTLAVGGGVSLTLNTRVAAALAAPVTLTNNACTGAQALVVLGLTAADGPQPPDGNEAGGADCAARSTVGTPVVAGQAQASVLKESSRDGVSWVDAVAGAPTVLATDNSIYWRLTLTTPGVAANAQQKAIPTLALSDTLPAILNVASPGPGIPAYLTPAAAVSTTVLAGSAGGGCPAAVAAGGSLLACAFTDVAPGTTISVVVQVNRPFEDGSFTNTATLSSPNALLTAAAGGQLSDAAALNVLGRTDPAITSKTVSPPNSATEPRVGQNISYTIVARNLGPNAVNGPFTVTDTLDPARFLVLGALAVGSASSPPMSCIVVVATGAVSCTTPVGTAVPRYNFYTVTVQARVLKPGVLPPAGTVSSFTNVAAVALDPAQNCEFRLGSSAACNDAASRSNNTGSALVDIKVPLIDVVQRKSRVLPAGQSAFGFGDLLRYRFRAQNNGPSRAENIQLTDRINPPPGYTVTYVALASVNNAAAESGYTLDVSKTAATVSCAQAGPNGDTTCTLAAAAANFLDAGAEVNFELTFTFTGPVQVASVGNTARVCADETAGYESSGACTFNPALAGNNIASVNDVVFPKTDLALTKTRLGASPVSINQPVQYALVLQNRGADSTTQMRLADLLPPNFEWVSAPAPVAVPGGFAGLGVSGLACTAAPAAIVAAGQQQTVSCVLDGNFPGSAAADNTVTVVLVARPKAGFYTGPYLANRPNTATVSPGLDGGGQPLSIDTNPANDAATEQTQVQAASLAGTVFQDRDRSGANGGVPQAAGIEPRVAGVTVTLTGTDAFGSAVNRSVTTDPNGNYSFADLAPAGASGYTLTETQPLSLENGPVAPPVAGPNAPTAGGVYAAGGLSGNSVFSAIALGAGAAGTNYNFPELRRPSLSGFVYVDVNANGVRDTGTDTPIAGATVRLLDAGTGAVIATTVTLADGSYTFTNLDPLRIYTVEKPPSATPIGQSSIGNGPVNVGLVGGAACSGCTAQPNTPAAGSARIATIDLSAGDDGTQFNFGEVPASQISGRVWADNNNNGVIDAGEAGLPGVTLVLTGTDVLGQPVNLSTRTAADGSYAYTGLLPGTYTVTEPTQPPGTVNGITSAGTLGGAATAPGVAVSAISGIVLPADGQAINNNFGEIGDSPDLRVSKRLLGTRFTVGFAGSYELSVRNVGESASAGIYTVSDRLPAGLTLAATPTGSGWACAGAAGAASFSCSSGAVINAGAGSANPITASVNVAAAAASSSPVNNAVMVDGGGQIDARRPSAAELDAFNNNPGALPPCTAAIEHKACRTPTPVQLAASVSGTVWYDVGSTQRLLDGGDRRLGGWLVEVVDTDSGAIVGRAVTAADGSYRVASLIPGVPLAVRFRDPGSGVVFGYPVNGDTAPGSSGASCDAEAAATGSASSCVGTGATPALTVILAPGRNLPQQSLPVDPSGVVYDSGLRQPVPASVVTLAPVGACTGWNPGTGLVGAALGGYTIDGGRVSMTVGSDGFYQFLFAPAAPARCTFGLTVTPPAGYTFQSSAIPPAAGPLLPPGAAGSAYAVQPQAAPPTAAVGTATTYFLSLTSGSGGANVIHNHIPLDPVVPSAIALAKTGDKAAAELGDSIRYTLTVNVTAGTLPLQTTVVDRLPAGFTYIRGTAKVGDVPIADPQGGPGPTLAFNLGPMPASRQLVLRYRVRVGVGAQQGEGINRARGHACGAPAGCVGAGFSPLAGSVATNEAAFRVRVGGGVFTTDACVLGKIFVDCNGNHLQDAEELGIPGVRLFMQDGTTLISDSEGKYSICGVPPRSAVLKVDPLTLPRGARLTTSSNRNLGDAGSLWLDLKNGELHRADFIEGSCGNTVLEQVKARRAQGEVRAPEPEKKRGPALRFDSKAHGLTPQSSPQQGTDGANQLAPKPRAPVPAPTGPVKDEAHVPSTELPMNQPPPAGRGSGTAPTRGGSNGAR
jgi:uncharacterized repeat protein (TIGR01451 family)